MTVETLKQTLLASLKSRKLLAFVLVVVLVVLGAVASGCLKMAEGVYTTMANALMGLFLTYCGGNVLSKTANGRSRPS